jgi:hypothetical protein
VLVRRWGDAEGSRTPRQGNYKVKALGFYGNRLVALVSSQLHRSYGSETMRNLSKNVRETAHWFAIISVLHKGHSLTVKPLFSCLAKPQQRDHAFQYNQAKLREEHFFSKVLTA